MLPYLLVLSFVMSWIALEKKSLNRNSFWVPLVVLVIFSSIRSYHVGTDGRTYVAPFISQLDVDYFIFNKDIEVGYQLLEYSLLTVTNNYFWLFLVTSLTIVYCYLRIIKIYSVDYWLSVLLFITLGFYTFFFNGLRQGIAIALFVLATPYLLEKKCISYLLVCLLASFFHLTVLFTIPFYFLVNLKTKLTYKIILIFIFSLFASSFLVSYLASANERYESYAEVSDKAGGLLTIGFYTILGIFIYLVSSKYKIEDKRFTKLFTFYACGMAFMLPIAMLSVNPSGPQRLLNYFTWMLILILPIVLKKINNKYIYVYTIFFSVVYFILTTVRFSNLVPYIINPIFEIF